MKEKTMIKNRGSVTMPDNDKDLSGFEKFESEVKSTIFNVLYVLLKDDESSHWKHIVLLLSDFFQIYYFSFDK